jgi:hypothetical protein
MYYVIVCLFKFSPKRRFSLPNCFYVPNYRSGISVEFLAVKMKVSCLATDGRHLGSGLVTRQIRKSEPKILFCVASEREESEREASERGSSLIFMYMYIYI